jgi:hypothetical protein
VELGIRSYAAVTEAGRRRDGGSVKDVEVNQRHWEIWEVVSSWKYMDGYAVDMDGYAMDMQWICNGYAMDMQWIWMFCFSPLFFRCFIVLLMLTMCVFSS